MVPQRFREPTIESYDGSGDTHGNVAAFQTQMFIDEGDNTVNCKMFVRTLKDVALCWFIGIPQDRSLTLKI